MMTCLSKTAMFLRNRISFCLSLICLFLILLVAPVESLASINQQVQKVVNLLNQKEYVQALDLLSEVEANVSNPEQLASLFAVAHLGRGSQLFASGDYYAARDSFLEGRQYNEDDLRLWQGEAMTWLKQGRYADAVSTLEEALGIAPLSADLYRLLGQAYYADGRMAEALDALTISIELGGGDEVVALLEKVRREWQVEQEMGQEVSGHFQLSFVDGDQAAKLATPILEALEEAYTELGSVLDFYPDVRIPVLLYSHKDFSVVTNSPDWAGAVYDGKIRLPLGGMYRMTDQLTALLYHEYTHVLVHLLAHQNVPVWLNEGLAELSGRRIYSLPLVHLQVAVEEGQLLDWDHLSRPFAGLATDKVPLAYEQSYSLVHFMIDSFGWYKVSELLERIGKQQPWQAAIATVYHDYGLDWPAILREWQASL